MTVSKHKPLCRSTVGETLTEWNRQHGRPLTCARNATLDGYCWQHHPNYRPTYATPSLNEWPPEECLP